MRDFRITRYVLSIGIALWVTSWASSAHVSAAGSIAVLKGQGTNPLYEFGMAVGASGGNNKFIAADFDGDGDTDLASRNASNTGVQYWSNNGDGSFTELTGTGNPLRNVALSGASANYFSAPYLLTGDFDGDGDVDIWNGNHQGSAALYRNDGGTFTVLQGAGINPLHAFGTAVGTGSFRAVAADLDGDGDTDLVSRNATSTGVQLWSNNGDGSFTELTAAANPLAGVSFPSNSSYFTAPLLAAGDFDGDGDADIFNANHNGTPAMYRNDGGTFTVLQGAGTNPLHAFGMAVGTTTGKFVAGDFDGDGLVDLVNRNSANTGVQFWRNSGDGTFTELTGTGNPFASLSFTANVNYFFAGFLGVGDFDGDGDTDIVNVNDGGAPALYRQVGSPPLLTDTVPHDDSVSAASEAPLQLTFNETIASGGTGVIEIRKYSDDSLVESIAGNSATVTGFGSNVITVPHTAPLQSNTAYYVLIKPRAFFDTEGQTFLGISDKSQLNFTTQGTPIEPYPVRSGAAASSSYTLSVNGEPIFVEKFGDVSFARFSFAGTAHFTVTANEPISSFGISPQSYQIQGSSSGNDLIFSINQPRTLIVNINNKEKLFLFADGLETAAPGIHDPNVVNLADYVPAGRDQEAAVTAYFQQAIDDTSALNNGAGGILFVPDGKYMTAQLRLKSNVHLYLQSGAWIKAVPDSSTANYPAQNGSDSSFIFISNASHVKISGRGIIDGNGMAMKTLNDKENIKLLRTADVTDLQIEDVYFLDAARWTIHLLYAKDVVMKNMKLINDLRGGPDPANPNVLLPTVTNTDGIDIDSSQNVTVDGAFIYTGDDSISPKVTNYLNLKRPTAGLQIKNNVLWSLKAALKVGDETLMDIGDIRFENNDVVHADRFLALWAGDASHIQNIEVINNRAEFIGGNYNERYFYFRIRLLNGNSRPGWIDQVRVKDFYVHNRAVQASSIEGYDSTHLVSNVTFDNVVIQGVQAGDRTDIPLDFKNAFYNNVALQPAGSVYSGTPLPSQVQITSPGNNSVTNNSSLQVSGTAIANSAVRVYIDDAAPVMLTADASGVWSFTPEAALAEGVHTVKAAAVDAAGNDSQSFSTVTFSIDLTAPAPPVINVPANNSHTSNPRPAIGGTAEPNSSVKVYVDNQPAKTATAGGTGSWSFTPAEALATGSHSVKARAVDTAGNESTDSGIVTFWVDSAVPIHTFFVEAEAMTLVGYTPEVQAVASGGQVIKVSGTGTAATQFQGQEGTYDLKVHYFDENDGAAAYRLFVNDVQIDAWMANQDLGSASVSDKSRTSRWVAGIPLRPGDIVKLEGTSNASEAARVDRLEFMLMSQPTLAAGSITGAVYSSHGAPLATVRIQAARTTVTSEIYQAYTDSLGQYTVGHLPEGVYTLTAQRGGYVDYTASGIQVMADSAVSGVNFILQESSAPPYLEAVQVSGTVPILTAGGAGYDLNGLSVSGKDQFGNSYELNGLSKTWTVKTGSSFSAINGTTLIPLGAGTGTVALTVYGKESNSVTFTVQAATGSESRVLLVDRRGMTSGAYASIAEAVASSPALKPGDVISLVPGSGPYHETVKIRASGLPGKPIVLEGNGELISGFTPFQFSQEANGQWTYVLPAPIPNSLPNGKSVTFQHLVAYNGQRLLLDQPSGQNAGIFTSDYAVLSSDGSKLILNPDKASPVSGWEIATLTNGIEIVTPASYQTYRNLRVTGLQNDGFNIHGTGTGLVFENIEAFNNYDEGFSSHDSTNSTIEGGKFWGNENGIYNQSRDTVIFTANNVQVYSNIGYGVGTQMGTNSFSNVQVWDNGISNIRVGGRVSMSNVVTYDSRWSQRPWVGYQESQNYKYNQEVKPYAYSEYVKEDYPITKTGTATVLPASQLPPFKGAFDDWRHIYFSAVELGNPAISGPEADPDGDGLSNDKEYKSGLHPKVHDDVSIINDTTIQGPASIQAGQPLDVIFGLLNVTSSVYAEQITVRYDPAKLQYIGTDSRLAAHQIVSSNSGDGRIDIVAAGLNTPVTGTVDLFTFHFQAMSPAQTVSTSVYVSKAIVSDHTGSEMELNSGAAYQVQIIVPVADKSALRTKLVEAEAAAGAAQVSERLYGHYPQAAVQELKDAIAGAKAVSEDGSAAQSNVDLASGTLAAAMQRFFGTVNTQMRIGDLGVMAGRYGESLEGNSRWNEIAMYDLNRNGMLDLNDVSSLASEMVLE